MTISPTEEIRNIRHQLAEQFNNDLDRIVADLRRRQHESGREYITLPRRPPRRHRATSNGVNRGGKLSVD